MNENRTIESTHPFREGAKPQKFDVVEQKPLSAETGINKKRRLILEMGNRQVRFIERKLLFSGEVDHILRVWKRLKDAGIPVVPTLRKTSEGTLIATDLLSNGGEIYGASTAVYKEGMADRAIKGLSQTDKVFLKSYPKLKEIIREQAQEIARTATNIDVRLATDDPFAIVFQDNGSFNLVLLDLSLVEMDNDIGKGEYYSYEANNNMLVDTFMSSLDETFQNLSKVDAPQSLPHKMWNRVKKFLRAG